MAVQSRSRYSQPVLWVGNSFTFPWPILLNVGNSTMLWRCKRYRYLSTQMSNIHSFNFRGRRLGLSMIRFPLPTMIPRQPSQEVVRVTTSISWLTPTHKSNRRHDREQDPLRWNEEMDPSHRHSRLWTLQT